MKSPADAPRAHDYGQLVARYWVVILLATVLSAGAGWLVWHDQRTFVASVKFLVVTPGGAQPFDAFYGNLTAMSRSITYQDLSKNPQVMALTEEQLGLSQSTSDLLNSITVVPTQSAVFDVLVTADNPDEARDTANALARNMVLVSNELQKVDSAAAGLVLIDAASGAGDARGKASSAMFTSGLLGLASSLVLIIGYALATGSVIDRRHVADIVAGAHSGRGGR